MKDFNSQNDFKFYRIIVTIINSFMYLGAIYGYMINASLEFIIHILIVTLLSYSFWIYPRNESNRLKIIIVIETFIYLYSLLIIYPGIFSSFMLICLIPGVSILFFLPRLFYFSVVLNIFLMTIIFSYVGLFDKGENYLYIYMDLFGNYLNFLASQAVFCLIFYLSHTRLLNQQFYFEQSKQAERLKSSGQIAAAVAHEIRNPITVVKGFLQLYQEDQSFCAMKKEHFAMMLDELQTAETVISDFLSIAKPKDALETHTVNIKDALNSVVDLLNSYALLNNISLKLDVKEDLYISCSLIEFKQLLINLLKNAIEASPFAASINVFAKVKDNYIEIHLVDSGTGMSNEELNSIGIPFYSLKSKGTGLGLTICFNIVNKYNGHIDFQSEKGKGTTVIIKFPSKNKTL